MDVVSFKALAKSIERVQAQDIVRDTYLRLGTSQGTQESVEDMLKPLVETAGIGSEGNDLNKLIMDFGKGF